MHAQQFKAQHPHDLPIQLRTVVLRIVMSMHLPTGHNAICLSQVLELSGDVQTCPDLSGSPAA